MFLLSGCSKNAGKSTGSSAAEPKRRFGACKRLAPLRWRRERALRENYCGGDWVLMMEGEV
jgi:hypothetical protein